MSASISTYTDLVTSEHSDKAKFMASIAASCQPFVDAQNQLLAMPGLYDVDVAVGAQLDAVGLWVGVSRFVAVPLAVWFSWNTSGLGWGQAIWHQPLTPTDGVYGLDDATFRLLIKARIIANNWNGSLAGAMPALAELFSGSDTPGSVITLQDNMNMSMTLTLSGQSPGALITAIITGGYLGLKPAGVAISYVDGNNLLSNVGGLLIVDSAADYPTSSSGLAAGALWDAGGGAVYVIPGVTPNPSAAPVYFGIITAVGLLALGGGNLPLTDPSVANQIWNNAGLACVSLG